MLGSIRRGPCSQVTTGTCSRPLRGQCFQLPSALRSCRSPSCPFSLLSAISSVQRVESVVFISLSKWESVSLVTEELSTESKHSSLRNCWILSALTFFSVLWRSVCFPPQCCSLCPSKKRLFFLFHSFQSTFSSVPKVFGISSSYVENTLHFRHKTQRSAAGSGLRASNLRTSCHSDGRRFADFPGRRAIDKQFYLTGHTNDQYGKISLRVQRVLSWTVAV